MLVVADSGPLIYLAAIRRLELLRELHDRVLVPREVYEEVVERGTGLPGSVEVAAATWLEITAVGEDDPVFRSLLTVLGTGEAAALALARREKADLVLVDERQGRSAARRLNLPVQGTLGVLVRAKRAGLVDAVAPAITELMDAGFWISDHVVSGVLKAAGESEERAGPS